MAKAEIAAIVFVFASVVAHIYQLQDHLPLWANVVWGFAVVAILAAYMWKNFMPSKDD
ncbi:MAG: hypothetical protein AAGA00_11665 [Pseudomonadota bacterium]